MEISEIVSKGAVVPALKVGSKKQLLQELAARAAQEYALKSRAVIDGLMAREQLGATAMGDGVAIPHARVPGLSRIVGVFARLERPVDFDAVDGQPVDLVFMLLAPEESGADHLRALARVSRLLRDPGVREKLRATEKAPALHALITEPMASRAA